MIKAPTTIISFRRHQGVSLVELMVTLVLGLIITAGVIQIFISNKATYSTQEGIVQIQENMRFATDTMAKDIRMAGFLGCNGSVPEINIAIKDADVPTDFTPLTGIQGWEAAGTGPSTTNTIDAFAVAPAITDGVGDTTDTTGTVLASWDTVDTDKDFRDANVLPKTDIIRAWFADTKGVGITSINENAVATKAQNITLNGILDVEAGDIVVLNDCVKADIAIACAVTTNNTSTTIDLAGCANGLMENDPERKITVSPENGEVRKLNAALYYLSKEGNNSNNPPSLYRRELSQNGDNNGKNGEDYINKSAVELVRGVENIQFLYGIDSSGDGAADRYVSAASTAITDWSTVVSVKISMLLATLDHVSANNDGRTYDVNGTTIDPPDDNRLRKVYTTTILLRNRTT